MLATLAKLIAKLARRPSTSKVYNPYRSAAPRENLAGYLKCLLAKNCGILAVGKAPGHLGCRHTGIPFTSEAAILHAQHPMLKKIASMVNLKGATREKSAANIWRVLEDYETLPVLWNSFPFHPHDEEKRNSNRTPNNVEIKEGLEFLSDMVDLFKPSLLLGIGSEGHSSIIKLDANASVARVPHPANREKNGPQEFDIRLRKLLKRMEVRRIER